MWHMLEKITEQVNNKQLYHFNVLTIYLRWAVLGSFSLPVTSHRKNYDRCTRKQR